MSKGKQCVWCGDTRIRTVQSAETISVNGDRQCLNCGAIWVPPLPRWAGMVFLVFSLLAALFVAGMMVGAVVQLFTPQPPVAAFLSGAAIPILAVGPVILAIRASVAAIRGGTKAPKLVVAGREEFRMDGAELLEVAEPKSKATARA